MKDNVIKINEKDIAVKEYKSQRVVTFKDIDLVHERPEGTARKRFSDNKKRFIEGEDYFKISPSEFRTAIGEMDKRQQNDVTLITEPGYLMLVKSFTDDLAWKVQRQLVNCYFRVQPAPPAPMQSLSPQLQLLINMELKQKEQDARIAALADKTEEQGKTLKNIHDTLFSEENDSRRWITKCIGEIAKSPSFDGVFNRFQKVWLESYDRLNEKIGEDIYEITQQAKEKAKNSGATPARVKRISRQSVIAERPMLRKAYAEAVREMMVAYCVEVK